MELTHQQKLVAAAMNAKGCTIDEIVAKVDADRDVIEEFVSGRNIKREKAEELRAKGMRAKDIAEALNVSQKTIYTWTNKAKKEPAPAEAETSSKEKYLQDYNRSVLEKSKEKRAENLQRIYMRLSEGYEHDRTSKIGIRFFGEAMGLSEGLINELKEGERA